MKAYKGLVQSVFRGECVEGRVEGTPSLPDQMPFWHQPLEDRDKYQVYGPSLSTEELELCYLKPLIH